MATIRSFDFVAELNARPKSGWPSIMLCLYTAESRPPYCAPMSRRPSPPVGALFDADFLTAYDVVLSENPSIHDGAILLGRHKSDDPYRVRDWSMRLFPPSTATVVEPNRGSAFNSCLEMSLLPEVDCMYLVRSKQIIRFEHGKWTSAS